MSAPVGSYSEADAEIATDDANAAIDALIPEFRSAAMPAGHSHEHNLWGIQ